MRYDKSQLDLFRDYKPPAQQHSATSVTAADAIEPKAETLRRAVLDYIASRGETGATDEEVHNHFGGNPGTYRARRVELMDVGLVHDSGRTRATRSGRQAVVWVCDYQPSKNVG